MTKTGKYILLLALAASVSGVSSCRMYKEGTLTEKKIQVAEERYVQEVEFDGTQKAVLGSVGKHYERYGDGPMHLSVLYNPSSNVDTSMKATQEAADLANTLRVTVPPGLLKVDIMPVKNLESMKALVTFNTYTAKAPDCAVMSGLDEREHRIDMDYEMGCSVQSVMARQIARPKDLLGRDFDSAYRDARGSSNNIDVQRAGAFNAPLGGESTSD